MYNFFRLLMPHLDKERSNYGIKESQLAKIYADALMLPPKEEEMLKHWKDPTKQTSGAPTGDFIGVLLHILKNRSRNTTKKLTIMQLNIKLDELSVSGEKKKKVAIITELIQSANI